jgi:hypothetical protein
MQAGKHAASAGLHLMSRGDGRRDWQHDQECPHSGFVRLPGHECTEAKDDAEVQKTQLQEQLEQRLIQVGRNLMDSINRDKQVSDWATIGHVVENGNGYAFTQTVAGKNYVITVHEYDPEMKEAGQW